MEINNKRDNKDKNRLLIKKYEQYLLLEKGYSRNTLDAYLSDLDKLLSFLILEEIEIVDVTLDNLQNFAAGLHDIGIHPRSQARIISGIKSFYRFLILDDYIESDPTELLECPKVGFKLPEVLSVNEIDSMISTIDLGKKEGQRNRAILETLYSCGLRVSELINLKLSELYFDEGFIKVEGKGNKQRLIPISPRAIKEIKNYFIDRNAIEIKKDFEDYLFISRRGTSLSRIMVFHIIKEQAETIGLKKNVSPHTFRHSFATHLLEGGANLRAIQCMLGHESITTTEIYTHIDRNMLRSEIIEHHPRNIRYREKQNIIVKEAENKDCLPDKT
jgi:integrase/recombinase XerD